MWSLEVQSDSSLLDLLVRLFTPGEQAESEVASECLFSFVETTLIKRVPTPSDPAERRLLAGLGISNP